jgi:hypothetical protein
MGQLADTAAVEEVVDDEGEEEVDDRAYQAELRATKEAFSPLSSTGAMPVITAAMVAKYRAAPEALPSQDPGEITEVKPPSIARLIFLALILVLSVLTAFVGWRNDWEWSTVKDAPADAVAIAFGFQEPAPEAAPARPEVRRADQMRGQMEFVDLRVELVAESRQRKAAVVSGQLRNGTNRIQKSIAIEAILESPPGTPLKKRVVQCCEVIAPEELVTVAQTVDHPHFAAQRADRMVRLIPGESRRFTVIFRDLDPKLTAQPLSPSAVVRFSETERVAP